MTKALLVLLMLAIASTALPQGDAPTLVKGQGSSTKYVGATVQVPNKQATKINSSTVHLELNNKNLLYNPSFETGFSGGTSGWTDAGTTALSFNPSYPTDGNYAGWYVLSASGMDLSQTSTAYANAFADGTSTCVARIKVKTNVALTICPIINSVKYTAGCVTTLTDGKYRPYQTSAFTCGSTNNGISIVSGTSVSGDVYLDEAFVGTAEFQSVNNISNLVNYTPTITTASGTMTNYTAVGNWYRVGQFMHGSVTITFNGAVGTWTTPKFTLPSGYSMDLGNYPFDLLGSVVVRGSSSNSMVGVVYYDSFNTLGVTMGGVTTHTGTAPIVEPGLTNVFPFSLASGNSIRITFKVPISGWASSGSIYSSTNADTDWQSCSFSSLAWQGLGTVSANAKCKRQGSDLLVRGDVTIGTVSSSTAQIPLPLFNGQSLTIADNSKNVNGLTAGRLYRYVSTNGFSKDAVLLASSSVGYLGISFAMEASTYNPLVPQTGVNLFGNNEYLMYEYRVPIQGWENSNIIIGQFNGLESCTDSYQCTDTFSARVDTSGVVSGENLDWLNGNCTFSSGNFSCPVKSGVFTQNPRCSTSIESASGGPVISLNNATTTVMSGYTQSFSAGSFTSNNQAFSILCQKSSGDYVGRTARAVASDQNVRSGYTNAVAYSARVAFGGSGSIINQKGNWLSSVTRSSTGNLTLNVISGKFVDAPNCSCLAETSTSDGGFYSCNVIVDTGFTATSIPLRGKNNSNTLWDIQAQIICHGQSP